MNGWPGKPETVKLSKSKKFYITTTLPYVNAALHLGHALEFVQADIIARHRKLLGDDVFFNTGTDEHGLKIYRTAVKSNKDPKTYVDEYAEKFKSFCRALNVDYAAFIRTTDPHHVKAAQEFWKRCDQNGDIYKGIYKVKYCVGCELGKTDSELVDGRCPLHPTLEIELIEEENYFFKFSKYQQPLLDFYKANSDFVIPESRFNEIKNFVSAGLQDFSISRLREKMSWGIPVPGDEKHVMYVWFEALINYVSTLGWPEDKEKFESFWGTKQSRNAVQIAGKDNLRQQSAMWQAMLMSAGLPNSKNILIHGFVTGDGGIKMSKTLGNVVDPLDVVRDFGVDALRYWFAREMPTFEDGEFTVEKFKGSYNSELANGIGNLASRIMKMAVSNGVSLVLDYSEQDFIGGKTRHKVTAFTDALDNYRLKEAADLIWGQIKMADGFIQKTEPFKNIKNNPEQAKRDISDLLEYLWQIGVYLKPFLPRTSERIMNAIKNNEEIKTPLFPRL